MAKRWLNGSFIQPLQKKSSPPSFRIFVLRGNQDRVQSKGAVAQNLALLADFKAVKCWIITKSNLAKEGMEVLE